MISFKTTKGEHETIMKIVARAEEIAKRAEVPFNRLHVSMDISATHANGCPLKLDKLLDAEGPDFSHDVFGIIRHIDRETGQLGNCFVPRYAA